MSQLAAQRVPLSPSPTEDPWHRASQEGWLETPFEGVPFGATLLQSEVLKTGSANFTFAAILAHEFTHILQFKMGEELPTKQKELEADYMAGWYMGNTAGMWLGQASSQALRTFYSKGDYEFNSPSHHGTPEERLRAVETGLKDARSPLMLAFSHAHKYVVGE